MLGRTHLAVGAAGAFLLTGAGLPGIGAAAVGSLLPDLDQENSLAARAFSSFGRKTGPAGMVFFGALYWWNTLTHSHIKHQPALIGLAAVFLAAALTSRHRTFTHSLLGLAVSAGLVWAVLPKLAASFALGYALHLAADMVSGRVTLLWPNPIKIGTCLAPTGGMVDLAVRLVSAAYIAANLIGTKTIL
ncbi:MAG: metal-dependent hydrolase [Syntrophothermus sp.]|uniref:metal-dependent hydrolase n=1 Tax=Syntrophothermus sp. TaxID=2736299 RepID=UPI00257F28A5|nr:metal-dependent hydrolase [Syntrophothermus sp.]NSW83912.1 metal-dependent hydrolase [Syntrophothermus sp.]